MRGLLRELDLLVANAGGASGGRCWATTREDWERTLGLNLLHAVDARSCAKVGWSDWQGSCRLVWQDAARTNRTTQRAAKRTSSKKGSGRISRTSSRRFSRKFSRTLIDARYGAEGMKSAPSLIQILS